MVSKIMCFLGGPGSGKSMQTIKIKSVLEKKGLDAYRFAPGEELRKLNIKCSSGNLADINVVNRLFDDAFSAAKDDILIIDGYPRSIDQAKYLIENISDNASMDVFSMRVDSEEIYNRLSTRTVCCSCGNVANKNPNNRICEKCGSEMHIRQDDISLDAINQRQQIFLSSIGEIIKLFSRYSRLHIHDIDSGLCPEDVLDSILEIIGFGFSNTTEKTNLL